MKDLWAAWTRLSLVSRIAIGLLLGVVIGVIVHGTSAAQPVGTFASLLGNLFVGALKAVAPLLVFILVTSAIAQHRQGNPTHIRPILLLYVIGTFLAALVAVSASFLFRQHCRCKALKAQSVRRRAGSARCCILC